MRQFPNVGVEKEKTVLAALCALLDKFHFDMGNTAISTEEVMAETAEDGGGLSDDDEDEEEGDEDEKADVVVMAETETGTTEVIVSNTANGGKSGKSSNSGNANTGRSIPRVVQQNILPWLESFLLKTEKTKKGQDTKVVRPSVALAMTKLIKRLEPPAGEMVYLFYLIYFIKGSVCLSFSLYWRTGHVLFHVELCIRLLALAFFYHIL